MSRTILSTLLFSMLLVAGARVVHAGDHPYPPGKVTVSTPDNWPTQAGGDAKGAMLVSVNPDKSAAIFITVTDAKDIKAAEGLLDSLLAPVLVKPKLGKAKPAELNGMKGISMEGTAKAKDSGKKVGVLVLLIETPVHKALLFIGLADDAKFAANKATLGGIIQSIKPLP